MKTTSLPGFAFATVAFAFAAACGGASSSGTAEAAPAKPANEAPPETKSEGPKVGDKIGQNAAERAAARAEAAKKRAEEQARKDAELAARGVKRIGWEDLMPEGEEERLAQMYQAQMAMLYSGAGIAEGSAADTAVQIGTFNTVKELNGKKIRIPGYTVPFEYGADAQIKEFLLVPYFGACIHAPPPPPNQTVFVMSEKPIKMKDLAQAVWIEGTIHTQTQESELADAAYTITLTAIEEYTY
ncbi:hypothetical protein BBF93_17180 [Hyphomonas sp. CACIAM 19H1]|uniref:DUF3299 domain-containing protein n=1 Tax=Hyphomonas sp. CACIAM 19H1 TaxID=1873716 RepID=UPI000DED4408|nr:DUF3299 domain-containing protein [Hyphomonas sp. CACIAM 19H1]AXE65771.1 hypothetical protein BBF93_17180 [Hyphomonas sp. CACIAM 19H1]